MKEKQGKACGRQDCKGTWACSTSGGKPGGKPVGPDPQSPRLLERAQGLTGPLPPGRDWCQTLPRGAGLQSGTEAPQDRRSLSPQGAAASGPLTAGRSRLPVGKRTQQVKLDEEENKQLVLSDGGVSGAREGGGQGVGTQSLPSKQSLGPLHTHCQFKLTPPQHPSTKAGILGSREAADARLWQPLLSKRNGLTGLGFPHPGELSASSPPPQQVCLAREVGKIIPPFRVP